MNRVKPHTDYKGPLESGLTKMCAIGLGKLEGARECHSFMFRIGLGAAIESAAEHILATGKILGGIGILENAYHETARVHAVPVDGFLAREEELLEESRSLMGRLPLQELELLICQRIGKNLSGTGLDTNVIGRSVHGYLDGVPWRYERTLMRCLRDGGYQTLLAGKTHFYPQGGNVHHHQLWGPGRNLRDPDHQPS